MNSNDIHGKPSLPHPDIVIQPNEIGSQSNLVKGPVVLTPYRAYGELRPAAAARVATLERQAPQIVTRAKNVGVEIQFLGTSPLFAGQRFYPGPKTDWVFGPADEHEQIVVPRPQRQALRRLVEAGIDFPLTYIAHEVAKERSAELPATQTGAGTALERIDAATLVGEVPPPPGALELGDRLGQQATRILDGIGKAAPIAGKILLGVAAAPLVLVGGAIAGLATVDPIVFGAVPAIDDEPGQPACFYQLVAWEW